MKLSRPSAYCVNGKFRPQPHSTPRGRCSHQIARNILAQSRDRKKRNLVSRGFFDTFRETLKINPSELTLKFYRAKVAEVNRLEPLMQKLTNEQLRAKTDEFRRRLELGETEEDLLCEAFAVVREMSKRVLGLRPFDSQIIGGMVLNDGKIAEMKTGEGKTLVAALPAYLNALSGKGAHVVTVNDYLARRDAENIGQVHKALGLSVGIIQNGMNEKQRREAYGKDVTYATNSEIGFDYLRDNLAQTKDDLVIREFNFCVIDEADSILIDEARTPLIISGPAGEPSERYITAARLAEILVKDVHYEVDEKQKSATITEEGTTAAQQVLGVDNIDSEGWTVFLTTAIKAKELFVKDIAYIVRDGEIIIVDEFTGRTMPGRRWSGGQHQAIEAKEGVKIQRETTTIASITYQNLFRGYNKLSGMTGTGNTEAAEFDEIYEMQVNIVPTNRVNQRVDAPDLVYTSDIYKWDAVTEEIESMHKLGRPTLVGTTSVEASEELSSMLRSAGIPHEVLNAKPENIERESEIVAQSGRLGAVTIATNMAGRGTDILLGGNAGFMASLKIRERIMPQIVNFTDRAEKVRPLNENSWKVAKESLFPCELSPETIAALDECVQSAVDSWGFRAVSELNAEDLLSQAFDKGPLSDPVLLALRQVFQRIEKEYKVVTSQERDEVRSLGGLHVIGTERHESRRIDNQLRGRAGRQGDPGSTRFFLSLDDQLFRIFGGSRIKNFMTAMDIDDRPIESNVVGGALNDAQERVENYFFGIRKTLFDFDVVISRQRESIYASRRALLESESMAPTMIRCAESLADDVLTMHLSPETPKDRWLPLLARIGNAIRQFNPMVFRDITGKKLLEVSGGDFEEVRKYLRFRTVDAYWDKVLEVEAKAPGCSDEAQRYMFLQNIDDKWKSHLQEMDTLKDALQFQSYAQRDPLVEYKLAGDEALELLVASLRRDALFSFYKFDPPPNLRQVLRIDPPEDVEVKNSPADTKDADARLQEERKMIESANAAVAAGIEALQKEFPEMIPVSERTTMRN